MMGPDMTCVDTVGTGSSADDGPDMTCVDTVGTGSSADDGSRHDLR